MVVFHPRADSGLAEPPHNNNGTPRPIMADDRPILAIHYTGVNVQYGDPGDTAAELRNLQNVALNLGKSFEYNYLIDQAGEVWEYAGDYRAAHSTGNNDLAIGVLIWNGVAEPVTDAQVLAVRWLRWYLQERHRLAADARTLPHKELPNAATACPGTLVMARWGEFLVPYIPPQPEPPVVDSGSVITIWKGTDCAAEFIGEVDRNGNALSVRWIQGDPRYIAVRDAHIAAGACVRVEPLTNHRWVNVVLLGPVPYGDYYAWTEADFFLVRPNA